MAINDEAHHCYREKPNDADTGLKEVEVDNKITGEIKEGLMVLVGFGLNDTTREVDYLASKLVKLMQSMKYLK